MKVRLLERLKSSWVILYESAASFIRNDDFQSAASLAFYTALALIPVFFLLTFTLGVTLGSSQAAFEKTQSLAQQFLPRYSGVILREVDAIVHLRRAFGIINIVLLVWAGTPLVASLRSTLSGIFRVQEGKHFAVEKFIDLLKVIAVILFLVIISTITFLDVLLDVVRDFVALKAFPSYLDNLAHSLTSIFVLSFLYSLFIPKTPLRYIFL
ncbi:MAG: YhjD/YihY/BrkB family envelope integrity protein, partial [Thermodesulfovibrionales bacterium]